MDAFDLVSKLVFGLIIVGVSFLVGMYATLAERKIAAFIQDRVGPNRNGPFGVLQPVADGGKLFMKEEVIPGQSNRFLFVLGPGISMTDRKSVV